MTFDMALILVGTARSSESGRDDHVQGPSRTYGDGCGRGCAKKSATRAQEPERDPRVDQLEPASPHPHAPKPAACRYLRTSARGSVLAGEGQGVAMRVSEEIAKG